MGDIDTRFFLVVIGWQPVIVRSDERFEEQPGASRYASQECDFTPIERILIGFWALADPVGDFRRKQPRQEKRQCGWQGSGPPDSDHHKQK